MSEQHDYIFSEPFLCVKSKHESRGVNGRLCHPPKLFVITYDEIQDAFSMTEVNWDAAKTLAPEAFSRMSDKLGRLRTLQADRTDAERRIADVTAAAERIMTGN